MYPILILREELVCLIILLFLAFVSRVFRMGKDGRVFNGLMTLAVAHVLLDMVTVWTVNHPASVPVFLNNLLHAAFFISGILYSGEFMLYVAGLPGSGRIPALRKATLALAAAYFALIMTGVLRIEYISADGTFLSTGPAVYAGYGLSCLYYLTSLFLLVAFRRRVNRHILLTLLPMFILLLAAESVQIIVREFLFTGGAVTAVTVGMFFSLENPSAVLERRARLNALNGLGSRSSYEHDMQAYDGMFRANRSMPFIFMFIDINNLRSVNGVYGHTAGDEYIGSVAVLLMENLKGAEHLYRMGGDEFLAVYRDESEKTVLRDIARTRESCRKEKSRLPYEPELVMGYAVSDANYRSLRDVLRVADYMMYRNKADMKRDLTLEGGTRLNLSGLTDRVFDAMCLTSEEFYPYISNLETNVTRVSPGMADFFGLHGEFFADFDSVWTERIHPEDLEKYRMDLAATMQGRQQYHHVRYRVMAKTGVYVEVTCRGSIYHGRDGEPDVFSGYLVNHGAPALIDATTGLQNVHAMTDRLNQLLREKAGAILLRLEVQNITRIRMLYGQEAGETVTRRLGMMLQTFCRGKGDAYSLTKDAAFAVILTPGDRDTACEIYGMIRKTCDTGIPVGKFTVPVGVLGCAVRMPGETLRDPEAIQSAAMFALEEARQIQGSRLHFFTPGMVSGTGTDNVDLLAEVHRDAVSARDHFFLRYQPVIQLESGRITGAEALVRWESKKFGEVSPMRFIPFLENDPAYHTLGLYILRQAVRQGAALCARMPGFRMNVNITAAQLCAESFVQDVCGILREEEFPAENLILELTERCKEMDFAVLSQRVGQLRENGIRVALDDMGTGFSTIDLLLHLPVDEIKLDYAFTRELSRNHHDQVYARVLCETAADAAREVCFEGVENAETAEYLKSFGDVLVQGFHFSRPLKGAELEARYFAGGDA